MFITLTNAAEGLEGLPIAISDQVVVSVFEAKKSEEASETNTCVYSSQGQTWMVQESVTEVVYKLNR